MAILPKKSKKPSKKQIKKEAAEAAERIKGSENRRTLQLDIDKIKEEIEENRAKRAAEAAIPEAQMAPEDLVLFKDRAEGKIGSKTPEEPKSDPISDSDEIELPSLSEIKSAADAPPKTVEALEAEMAQESSKLERLDTEPDATEPDIVKPVDAELENAETGGLVPLGKTVTRWQKILGAGKQRQIMIGLGALVAAIVIGAALWVTRGWREWTGNLIVFSIPVLILLTYVLEYFSQDRFWEDYRHIKFLRKENRADAVVLIPLVMFMGLVGLYSYMSFGQAFVHYVRFIAIATGVWMGLIWLTRRVPPYRKKEE